MTDVDEMSPAAAAERARIEVQKIRAAGRIEVREAERNARDRTRTKRNTDRAERTRAATRTATVLAPLVGVNGLAIGGQLVAFHGLGVPWPLAVGVAAVVESVALFLSFHAHLAAMSGDAATRLRLGAYFVGAGVGALNASHWIHEPKGGMTFALIFGSASILSPWLWGIHTRRAHRDQLHDMGLVDQRTARFSMSRWLWFPTRTFRAHRWAVWYSECDPARAVALSGVKGPGKADEVTPSDDERGSFPRSANAGGPLLVGEVPADEAPADEHDEDDDDDRAPSETTYANGVMDAAVLMAATPPPWQGVTQIEAVARADALLPGRKARELSLALREVGITIKPETIRSNRSKLRKRSES